MNYKIVFYRFLRNNLLKYPRYFAKRLVLGYLFNNNREIVPFSAEFFEMYKKIIATTEILMSAHQAFILYCAVKAVEKISGDIIEVGVYKGGSAKFIAELKNKKILHLFDTFSGLQDANDVDIQADNTKFVNKDFISDYDIVCHALSNYKNILINKGYFPNNANHIKDKKFCLVHLDVDTYTSTLNSLSFVYSRMSRGGFILSHDYSTAKGVTKAVDEFFKDKPETIIQVSNKQCLIVKL